jgi:L-alanine-DL-glutamate epimerase-like enolase superfamily enzyme
MEQIKQSSLTHSIGFLVDPKISAIKWGWLKIPFKEKFKHSSAERAESLNFIVKISSNHFFGFGESCPRDYVTHETERTVEEFVKSLELQNLLNSTLSLEKLLKFNSSHKSIIDRNPAAYCAFEIAVLDLLSKTKGQTVDLMLHNYFKTVVNENVNLIPKLNQPLARPSAVLGLNLVRLLQYKTLKYLIFGFRDFKFKITAKDENVQQFKTFIDSLIGKLLKAMRIRIRLDVNNNFQNSAELDTFLKKINYNIWAVEEPFAKKMDINSNLIDYLNPQTKIILDESFTQVEQLSELSKFKDKIILNIRISKMGGLLRSYEIVKLCQKLNMSWGLGSQVGETSLLTRAGLTLLSLHNGPCQFYEGAFSSHLLSVDPCNHTLKLGIGAQIYGIEKIEKTSGFGINMKEEYITWTKT